MKLPFRVLAIDPGTAKCGIALVEQVNTPTVLHREIVSTDTALNRILELCTTYRVETVLIGDATGGKPLCRTLCQNTALPVHTVCEERTSERARQRYRKENPPRGWRKLLPAGLQTPAEPYDDYAAVILAEDWLTQKAKELPHDAP
jgi:RNase H-fold protein (predicted Holliday junction resolvase)